VKCDILVVGCGLVGSTFALEVAKRGLDVLVVERKFQIASPMRGGEAVCKPYYDELAEKIKVLKEVPRYETKGVILSTGKIEVVNTEKKWGAYVLERRFFEKELVETAIAEGARVMLGTEMRKINFTKNRAGEVIVKQFNKEFKVEPKVVVDAGGFASTLRKKYLTEDLGIKTEDWGNAIEFEIANANLRTTELLQLFMGEDVPGGYAYIFPKGKKRADVGAGIRPYFGGEAAIDIFYEVLRTHSVISAQVKDAQQIEIRGGGIDVGGPVKNLVRDNVVVIGDAANQNFSDVGEGIPPGLLGSIIAAEKVSGNIDNLQEAFSSYERDYYSTEIGKDVIKTMNVKNRINDVLSSDVDSDIKFGVIALLKTDVLDNTDKDVSKALKCENLDQLVKLGREQINSKKMQVKIIPG